MAPLSVAPLSVAPLSVALRRSQPALLVATLTLLTLLALTLLGALSSPAEAQGSAPPGAAAAKPAPVPIPIDTTPPADLTAPPADAAKTASGLVTKVLRPGTGKDHPDGNDFVAVHFIGWTPAGKVFQNSYENGTHAVMNLDGVFPGWREGMQLMVAGEKRRLWIPAELGPSNPSTGPRGAAVFDVELLGINAVPNPPAELDKPPADTQRTISGAFFRRTREGWGEEKPGPTSVVLLNYTGWTTDGATFDSTFSRGRPTAFVLDKVLAPFADVVQTMVEGEKQQIWIPGNIAAGQWQGSPQGTLVFEVELIKLLPPELLAPKPPGKGQPLLPVQPPKGAGG